MITYFLLAATTLLFASSETKSAVESACAACPATVACDAADCCEQPCCDADCDEADCAPGDCAK
ncbi:MAG: hypothetical protein JSR82_19250 [Verrucomicrobia bacterium]|nr:hypothetical protein [Verrucomicrobiota bacterium]